MSKNSPISHREHDNRLIQRLSAEYAGVLSHETVVHLVAGARHAVEFFGGEPTPGIVERIARDHLKARSAAWARHIALRAS